MQAVAAEALLPGAALLAQGAPGAPAGAGRARQLLWDALLELEELSPATGSVMTLLAEVHAAAPAGGPTPAAAAAAAATDDGGGAGLGQLVPRLWPFLRHGLTSVRHASLRCLAALLASRPLAELLPGEELQRAARLLFQCLLLERSAEVLAAAQAAWQLLVQRADPGALEAALPAEPVLAGLFQLAATPAHTALDSALLLTVPLPRKRAGTASKARLAGAAESQSQLAAAAQQQQQQQQQQQRESLVVEADGDAARTTRMRLAAAAALGQLACALGPAAAARQRPNPAQSALEALLRGSTATGRLLASLAISHWAQLAAGGGGGGDGAAPAPAAADPSLQQLLGVLLEALGQPASVAAGYAELAQLHAQLRGQASGLIARALRADVALAMPGPLDALGHAGALALAAQVPAAAGGCRRCWARCRLRRAAAGRAAGALVLACSPALPHPRSNPDNQPGHPPRSCPPCRRQRAAAGPVGAAHHGGPAGHQRGGAAHQRGGGCRGGGGAPGLPAPQAQHHHPAAGGRHPARAAGAAAGRGGGGAGAPGAAVRRPQSLAQRQVRGRRARARTRRCSRCARGLRSPDRNAGNTLSAAHPPTAAG